MALAPTYLIRSVHYLISSAAQVSFEVEPCPHPPENNMVISLPGGMMALIVRVEGEVFTCIRQRDETRDLRREMLTCLEERRPIVGTYPLFNEVTGEPTMKVLK